MIAGLPLNCVPQQSPRFRTDQVGHIGNLSAEDYQIFRLEEESKDVTSEANPCPAI